MSAEILAKLLAAEVIPTAAGLKLQALTEGTFVQHKSWGFGRIARWDAAGGHVIIDFITKKGHPMPFVFAAESLTPMPETHYLAHKIKDPAAAKARALNEPLAAAQHMLESLGGKASLQQLQNMLAPDIVANDAAFKAWWDKARKAMKADGRFLVPAKKTEPIEYRAEAVAKSDDALTLWNKARKTKEQVAALEEIAKHVGEFSDPATKLKPVVDAAAVAAHKAKNLDSSAALELFAATEELALAAGLPVPSPGLAEAVRGLEKDLVSILMPLGAARLRAALRRFPEAFGVEWTRRAATILPRVHGQRVATEICRLLVETGEDEALRGIFDQHIRALTITPDMLYWLASERAEAPANEFVSPELLDVILTVLERDQANDIKRGTRLRDLLQTDRDLIPDLVREAEIHRVRTVAAHLLKTVVYDELTRRSLLARIIKIHPAIGSLLEGGDDADKADEGPLLVSWESLEQRKAELDELVKVKIPQNVKDIAIARSYGDLRENFEFKSAKQMQGVLQRRRRELEGQLADCRGTDFANPDTSQVGIGTVVDLRGADGQLETFTILGAWDTDPDKNILSYLAPYALALRGKKVGEKAKLSTGEMEIVAIRPARPA